MKKSTESELLDKSFYICEPCKTQVKKTNKARHERTSKHQREQVICNAVRVATDAKRPQPKYPAEMTRKKEGLLCARRNRPIIREAAMNLHQLITLGVSGNLHYHAMKRSAPTLSYEVRDACIQVTRTLTRYFTNKIRFAGLTFATKPCQRTPATGVATSVAGATRNTNDEGKQGIMDAEPAEIDLETDDLFDQSVDDTLPPASTSTQLLEQPGVSTTQLIGTSLSEEVLAPTPIPESSKTKRKTSTVKSGSSGRNRSPETSSSCSSESSECEECLVSGSESNASTQIPKPEAKEKKQTVEKEERVSTKYQKKKTTGSKVQRPDVPVLKPPTHERTTETRTSPARPSTESTKRKIPAKAVVNATPTTTSMQSSIIPPPGSEISFSRWRSPPIVHMTSTTRGIPLHSRWYEAGTSSSRRQNVGSYHEEFDPRRRQYAERGRHRPGYAGRASSRASSPRQRYRDTRSERDDREEFERTFKRLWEDLYEKKRRRH